MSAVKHRPLHRKPTITLYMPGSPRNTVEVPRDFAMADPRAPWTRPDSNPRVEPEQRTRDMASALRRMLTVKPEGSPNV